MDKVKLLRKGKVVTSGEHTGVIKDHIISHKVTSEGVVHEVLYEVLWGDDLVTTDPAHIYNEKGEMI